MLGDEFKTPSTGVNSVDFEGFRIWVCSAVGAALGEKPGDKNTPQGSVRFLANRSVRISLALWRQRLGLTQTLAEVDDVPGGYRPFRRQQAVQLNQGGENVAVGPSSFV